MEETSTTNSLNVQEEPLRPSSTSPGPPPSKRSAPGILENNQQTLPSISSMRGEITTTTTTTDCDSNNKQQQEPSPETITGDLNPIPDVSSNNLSREYSTGSFIPSHTDEIQLDHPNNNQQQQRPLIIPSFQSPPPAAANPTTSSFYNFQNELQHHQQVHQVTPTHTQHHMGWMQQSQMQQQHLSSQQLLVQQQQQQASASYHDHNYNSGGGIQLGASQASSSSPSTSNLITSTSPPGSEGNNNSGIHTNFYNPQSPYYGIHPQHNINPHHHHHHNHNQVQLPSSSSSNSSGVGYIPVGAGNGTPSHFAYSHHHQQQQQLPGMQMMNHHHHNPNNFGGATGPNLMQLQHSQPSSSASFNQHQLTMRANNKSNQQQQHVIQNQNPSSSSMMIVPSQHGGMGMPTMDDNGGGGGGGSVGMCNSNTTTATTNNKSPWTMSTTESPYPGGLEVLWREVPEECQKLMNLQDVPETARQRGYFTVCELIALKRSLVSRMGHDRRPTLGVSGHQEQQQQLLRSHSSDGMGNNATTACTGDLGSIGMAVKDAMNVLQCEGSGVSNSADGQNTESTNETNNSNNPNDGSEIGMQKSHNIYNAPDSSTYALQVSHGEHSYSSSSSSNNKRHSSDSTVVGPPPPYRTATLVFKLLVIGGYQFRSFSEVNPNRLRVLFNTQRLTYECQLSIVRPPREGMPVMRKLLTVDIGFDQISVIRFGTDKLFLRVEGPPLLTVTYNPANEDLSCPPLSQQDLHLLEQIDKGQLKLSPCHQLYFLNERLVHLLEYQFKELPRFRHILQDGFNNDQQQQHQQQMIPSTSSQSNPQQQQNQTQNSITEIP